MAYIKPRKRKNGATTYYVRWQHKASGDRMHQSAGGSAKRDPNQRDEERVGNHREDCIEGVPEPRPSRAKERLGI
jgi:hypothetical protein